MPLARVEFDPSMWERAEQARRLEWQSAAAELVSEGRFLEGAMVLCIAATEQGTSLELRDAHGTTLERVAIARDALSRHVTEYVDICRKLASDDVSYGSARFEALDMAKRVAHDDAGRTLARLCAPLGCDHATGRRLFTLIFALRVDTTKLVGVFGHRPIR